MPETIEKQTTELDTHKEEIIRNFLQQVLHRGGERPIKKYPHQLIDISSPHHDDLLSISQGDAHTTNLRTVHGPEGQVSYHFYVGQTEFHIHGQAADDLSQLINEHNE